MSSSSVRKSKSNSSESSAREIMEERGSSESAGPAGFGAGVVAGEAESSGSVMREEGTPSIMEDSSEAEARCAWGDAAGGAMAAGWPLIWTVKVMFPTVSRSPAARAASWTRTSLRKVPLEEPRSRTLRASASRESSQCLRETAAEGMRRLQSGFRPMV